MKLKASYKNDKLDGPLEGWYDDGHPHFIKQYDNGKPIGMHKEYFPISLSEGALPMRLSALYHYNKEGDLTGEQKTYYPAGQLQSLVTHERGVLHGRKQLFDVKGKVSQEAFYEHGKLTGRYYECSSSGQEFIYQYENNRKNGPHEVYLTDQAGVRKLLAEMIYVNDKLQGDLVEYGAIGKSRSVTPFIDGVREGIAKVFNERGIVILEIPYAAGKREGVVSEYYPNGTLKKQLTFVADKRDGQEIAFSPNGKISGKSYYKRDKLDGAVQEWNEHEVLIYEAHYKEGLKNGEVKKYFDNGKPKVIQHFINDQLDGVKKSYDGEGKLSETRYKMGERIH